MSEMKSKPTAKSSLAQKELEETAKQFDEFEKNIKEMTLDRMNEAPLKELEPQTKMSQSDIEKSKDFYLKPIKTIGCKEKFNEKFREDYNFAKEYVPFIAEHKEITGDTIDVWTKPFPGVPAEEWAIPPNKPVWGPRYLAERLHGCYYHRFTMQNQMTGIDGTAQYYGSMVVDTTVQRIDAIPVSSRKSIFMGKN